jgi:hypothetical protein
MTDPFSGVFQNCVLATGFTDKADPLHAFLLHGRGFRTEMSAIQVFAEGYLNVPMRGRDTRLFTIFLEGINNLPSPDDWGDSKYQEVK